MLDARGKWKYAERSCVHGLHTTHKASSVRVAWKLGSSRNVRGKRTWGIRRRIGIELVGGSTRDDRDKTREVGQGERSCIEKSKDGAGVLWMKRGGRNDREVKMLRSL